MAGTIAADVLMDGAGNTTAMDNAIYGSAKAWGNFNGSNSPGTRQTYNMSSFTRVSQGQYSVAFTNAMPDTNYAVAGITTKNDDNAGYMIVTRRLSDAYTTTAFKWRTVYDSSTENISPATTIIVLR